MFEGMNESEVCSLTQDDFNTLESKRQREIAEQCAEKVFRRYEGKKCMGTTIHAPVPRYLKSEHFFFDEEFTKKVHLSSPSKQSSCAGSAYYFQQLQFVKDHYVVYDGAIEGVRNGCFNGEQMCQIHRDILGVEWRGSPVNRVPAPVPELDGERSGFHYKNPDLSYNPDKKDTVTVDEFCPRVKLEEFIKQVGAIDI